MPLCALAYRIFTFAVEEKAGMTIKENQMIRSREMRFLNLANKIKRARGTTGATPVRETSCAIDTLRGAVEFPDEAVDRSVGNGLARGDSRTTCHVWLEGGVGGGTSDVAMSATAFHVPSGCLR